MQECAMNMKNAKTILFTALITAMVLPFSAINMAVAQTDDLEQDYEEINRLGELGYNIHLRIENTTHAKAKEQLQTQFENVLRQLEHYGVTTIEKAESDPYWAKRSSQHQNGELNTLTPVANFLLPAAYAVGAPDFQLGYEHDFWYIFSWHQWTGDWITIAEFHSDDDSINLQDDYDWVKAKWKVRGTNILVSHLYDYDLKDGFTTKQSADGTKGTIHNGIGSIAVISMSKYSNSPMEGWTITADWTVQSINDYP